MGLSIISMGWTCDKRWLYKHINLFSKFKNHSNIFYLKVVIDCIDKLSICCFIHTNFRFFAGGVERGLPYKHMYSSVYCDELIMISDGILETRIKLKSALKWNVVKIDFNLMRNYYILFPEWHQGRFALNWPEMKTLSKRERRRWKQLLPGHWKGSRNTLMP